MPSIRRTAIQAVRVLAVLALGVSSATAQLRRATPAGLTDAEFWDFFTTMSEPGGSFLSENFVSNEVTFQHPIPTLQRTVTKDGVYLGVGPEQNFTYIANLKPRMAVIFDIRRQNAMAHLMYKALFELSPTRGEFVSRLFSRPMTGRVATTARVSDMFAVAQAAPPSDSAYRANQAAVFNTLVDKHKFALTTGDSAAIEHLMEVFYAAGPDVNYGYRLGSRAIRPAYATYGYLQTLTNADSVQMAFLANEDLYRSVREMHLRNLIVPVVGDFAGPKAIRAVGEYLKQRNMVVSAFYTSNVEQYLFQNGVSDRFYANVATLPIDSGSTLIRSVPPGAAGGFGGGSFSFSTGGVRVFSGGGSLGGSLSGFGGGNVISVNINTVNGVRDITIVQDSAGQRYTRTYRDSAGVLVPTNSAVASSAQADSAAQREIRARAAAMDSLSRQRFGSAVPMPNVMRGAPSSVMVGGGLVSGIASIRELMAAHAAGTAQSYRDVILMTKISDWK